ncbi:epimerase, partial [Eikenella corrodens]|nr:epimerase [Eikenella corrodens]
PLIALPNGGYFDVQPVHVADVAQGLANLLTSSLPHGTVLNMTGSRSLTLAQYLSILRQTLHRKPAQHVLPIPLPLLHPMLPLAKLFSNGIVSPDSFTLLQQGSCADSQAFAELLGRPPLSVEQFAAAEDIGA